MSLELTTGDTAPTLTGTVNADLTGAAIVVHIQRPDATVISRAGTIVGAVAGTWSLTLITGDLTIKGTHYIEVEVLFSNGKTETFRKDSTGYRTSFRVEPQIA